MPEPGYDKKFARRRPRTGRFRGSREFGSLESWILKAGETMRHMPRAYRQLVEFGVSGVILAILLTLYLGAVNRGRDRAFQQLDRIGATNPAVAREIKTEPPK